MTAANANPVLANAQQRYAVHRSDLPLSCPLPSMGLWNSHPRVYMAIETQGGESDCPYWREHFVLVASALPHRPAGHAPPPPPPSGAAASRLRGGRPAPP